MNGTFTTLQSKWRNWSLDPEDSRKYGADWRKGPASSANRVSNRYPRYQPTRRFQKSATNLTGAYNDFRNLKNHIRELSNSLRSAENLCGTRETAETISGRSLHGKRAKCQDCSGGSFCQQLSSKKTIVSRHSGNR